MVYTLLFVIIRMSFEEEFGVSAEAPRERRIFQTEELLANVQNADQYLDSMLTEFEQALNDLSRRFADATNGVGMPDSFVDSLDRVDKKKLTSSDTCAICSQEYLSDPYPLVVVLPCPGKHMFDLECISPWLKRNSTCPLCRHDMAKKEPLKIEVPDEEEEEDYDDMYG